MLCYSLLSDAAYSAYLAYMLLYFYTEVLSGTKGYGDFHAHLLGAGAGAACQGAEAALSHACLHR